MVEKNTPPLSPAAMDSDDEDGDLVNDDIEIVEDDNIVIDDEEVESDDQGATETDAEVTDDAIVVFTRHTGSVFCCHIEPKENHLIVSGGEDDKAYVWNISSGQVLFECTNHRDSVTSAMFSHDGIYVATADMSGFIQVWKVATKSVIWEFEIGDLSWLEWHPASHVLLAGAVNGETWMWKIPSGDCKTFQGHGERNECGKVLPDGKRLAVGFADGMVKIYDLKTAASLQNLAGGLAHSNAITSIDCHRDNNLIITGSLDVTAKLYNTQTGKVLATLMCENSDEENSVEAATFCPDQTLSLAVTGTLTGKLTFWDIPSQVERHIFSQRGGVVKIVWHPILPHLLFTASLDGVVRLLDAKSGQLVRQFTGHTANILDITISSSGNHIVTSSDDRTCRVFNVGELSTSC